MSVIGRHTFEIATLLLGAVVILCALFMPSEDLHIPSGEVKELRDGWTVVWDGGGAEDVQLPIDAKLPAGTRYTATTVLGNDFSEAQTLRIRSSMQELTVRLDGQLLYTDEQLPPSRFTPPPASIWRMVPLPPDSVGKQLELIISSPVAAFSGTINIVSYGSPDALLYDLVRDEFFGIILSFGLLFSGIVLLAAALSLRQLGDRRFLYLGLFAVALGLWILSEARVLQLFTGSRFLLGAISYIMVGFIPIPLTLYLRDIVLTKYRRLLSAAAWIFGALILLNLSLQLSGTAYLINTISLTLILLVLTMAAVLVLLFRESITQRSAAAKRFLLYAAVLAFFLALEVTAFFFRTFDSISSFLRIGIVVFFIFLVLDSVRYFNDLLAKRKEALFFQELAFKDILTGGLNRNAFERDVELLMKDLPKKCFRLVLMDLNELKAINDTYGHRAGDEALILSFSVVDEVFSPYGSCYRISGDEFACLLEPLDELLFREKTEALRTLLHSRSSGVPFTLELAIGSGICPQSEGSNFRSFYHEIDNLMYEDKKQQKQSPGNKPEGANLQEDPV